MTAILTALWDDDDETIRADGEGVNRAVLTVALVHLPRPSLQR
jgi:hypothetical protein